MSDEWIETGPGFWNIRGSRKIAGLLEVGTQMSLVRRASGKFVLLDSYLPDEATKQRLFALTHGGRDIEAILNLHPFHTKHVAAVAALFPGAKLFGTSRHVSRFPELAWQATLTEGPGLAALFGEDFRFSVPRGVAFVPENENYHFASVLALHPASKTLHVDDTLTWVAVPPIAVPSIAVPSIAVPFIAVPFIGGLRFHPTLARVLDPNAFAAAEFRVWLAELRELFTDVRTLCTAHLRPLPPREDLQKELRRAIDRTGRILAKHERKYAGSGR